MLARLLRPSHIDGARHAAAVLKLIVTRLRLAGGQDHRERRFRLLPPAADALVRTPPARL